MLAPTLLLGVVGAVVVTGAVELAGGCVTGAGEVAGAEDAGGCAVAVTGGLGSGYAPFV